MVYLSLWQARAGGGRETGAMECSPYTRLSYSRRLKRYNQNQVERDKEVEASTLAIQVADNYPVISLHLIIILVQIIVRACRVGLLRLWLFVMQRTVVGRCK